MFVTDSLQTIVPQETLGTNSSVLTSSSTSDCWVLMLLSLCPSTGTSFSVSCTTRVELKAFATSRLENHNQH